MVLVPMLSNMAIMFASCPRPNETTNITAPMPIIIPNSVSAERSLFARKALKASLTVSIKLIAPKSPIALTQSAHPELRPYLRHKQFLS